MAKLGPMRFVHNNRTSTVCFSFGWKVLVSLKECVIKVLTFWVDSAATGFAVLFAQLHSFQSGSRRSSFASIFFSSSRTRAFLQQSTHLPSLCHFCHCHHCHQHLHTRGGMSESQRAYPALGLRTILQHQRTSQNHHYHPQTSWPRK